MIDYGQLFVNTLLPFGLKFEGVGVVLWVILLLTGKLLERENRFVALCAVIDATTVLEWFMVGVLYIYLFLIIPFIIVV